MLRMSEEGALQGGVALLLGSSVALRAPNEPSKSKESRFLFIEGSINMVMGKAYFVF